MARVTDVFVSGTMENVVFYRRMGTSCARIKRGSIQQTSATKIRSANFGIAAKAAKGLRSGLQEVMPFPTDRSMQSRFSGAIAKWLGLSDASELPPCNPVAYVTGFQFTSGASFNERFKVTLTVTLAANNITVAIDAFTPAAQIAAPAGTSVVKLVITVAACTLQRGEPCGSVTQSISIPYNNTGIAAQTLLFNVPGAPGSLVVTAARLQYYKHKETIFDEIKEPAWMPAGIVNAAYL